jgi:hypothetical protein
MRKPETTLEAVDQVHTLLSAAANDLTRYLDAPEDHFAPEYFESVKDAVLDAHMLVSWLKDQIKGGMQ